ncbi:ATP-binding cassette domain-containing protein [Streptomyces sp. Z26]|uniref:ATP-binding cassette domain-containing protein n=1 Tax=Streptomyces TaxID=1883 RepID=UPI000EF1481E|nr:ATP-binding cassette domain-containing protein [Streptomyces sp. Z26]RLL70843.1 ATP-binding cassette domain-containing protein [Streptomyces sp. Z26]
MIEVQQLTKRYGPTLAVDGLSFTVEPGRVTGFLGPNGAGKSTTMRTMIGLDRPTSGRVLIDGGPYARLRHPLRQVGALLEAGALHGGRTARAHLLGLARSNRIPVRRVDEVLDVVGLTGVADRRTQGFSLGMTQRLGVASALLGDPPVLLMDEPVNGLDPEGILWIRGLMKRLAAEGRTVFVSSHLMSEMALTAEHLIVIGRGRLLADTSVEQFVARNSRAYVLVRSPEPERMRAVLAEAGVHTDDGPDGTLEAVGASTETVGGLAARHGVTVYEISPRTASLEDAFMQLTATAADHRADQGADEGVRRP